MNVESVRIISRPVSSLQDSSDAPHPLPRTSVLGFPIPPLRGSASVGQARIAVPPIFQHRSAVCTIMNLAQANVGKFLALRDIPTFGRHRFRSRSAALARLPTQVASSLGWKPFPP